MLGKEKDFFFFFVLVGEKYFFLDWRYFHIFFLFFAKTYFIFQINWLNYRSGQLFLINIAPSLNKVSLIVSLF